MQLVADRFAVTENGDAMDLATGARVELRIEPAGDAPQQVLWNERCAALHAIRHPAIAPLVDFGLTARTARFEAWGCGPRFRESADHARAIHARATAFLRATNATIDAPALDAVRTSHFGTGIWLPGAGSGYPSGVADPPIVPLPIVEHGVRTIDRPAVTALSEMFRAPAGPRPQIASLWGPPQSGKREVLRALARAARLQGFVPVAAHLLDSTYGELWQGRSLLVLALDSPRWPWTEFLRTSLTIALPHVLIVAGETEVGGVEGVPLRAVAADALVAAVRPSIAGTTLEPRVCTLARHARGLPGRFVRRLWRYELEPAERERSPVARTSMAAEPPAIYSVDAASAGARADASSGARPWPLAGELASLRKRLETARTLLAAGSHAPGIRDLRQSIGALDRRCAWVDAATGGVHLAGALLRRGRPVDAQKAIDEAKECAARAGGDGMLIDLAILSGDAWIDRARLDEAEGILATALAAARAARDAARAAAASIAMGRCLFWRGRFDEATSALEACRLPLTRELAARRSAIASRVALARGDVSEAMAAAAAAADEAAATGSRALRAAALHARALVHLAIGDFEAAEAEIASAIADAHAAHDPLCALGLRLLRAEAERRRGRGAAAAAQLVRLRRPILKGMPLLRARWQLGTALCAPGDAALESILARHIAATGLGGLAVFFSPRHGPPAAGSPAPDAFLDHVVSILRVCQTAEEDAVVLKDVCVRVREHVHAAAVAIIAVREGQARRVAADGSTIDGDIAARAVQAQVTIAPHRRDDRIEAAAPVMYAGSPIAAICARWTPGSTYDVSRAASVLTMTAAAAAPVVAIAIESRQSSSPAGDGDLLGVSASMTELRRHISLAAAAPFSVLIDGESGSGKELVARAIHRGGTRRHKPFCTLNCAALPEDLVEAELFGHARGAFTGAAIDRAGVFEDANGGTLFLYEIGELSPRAQAKVLRVIQEGELRRVGETASRRVDVRIVSATNRDLRRDVDAGRFRLDLLYRLDVIHVAVPRLRDRPEDVPVLAEHFWRDAAARVGSRATLSPATLAALTRYHWPGNVRELQNVLAALAVRCPKRGVVPPSTLPPVFAGREVPAASRLDEARRIFEERFVRAALVRTGGHRGRAAAELGVTRQGLTKLMTRLGISP